MPSMLNFRDALNQALHEEFERDDRVFIIGEEVGRAGGMFQVSKGLYDKFGARRVIDTPISEMGFSGVAVGAAQAGLRPICEYMNICFAMQAMDHLINSAAKTYYMSGGRINSPIVFRGPQGISEGSAAEHIQDFSAWFAHCPGLKVMAPATSEDAKGLLKAAIQDDNPVVFLENEMLYEKSFPVIDAVLTPEFILPIGKAKVEHSGNALTIVAYSNGVSLALEAAEQLKQDGIEAEVINLRTLRPLDFETVEGSIAKTGRCVTVDMGWPFGNIGAEIAARVFESPVYNKLKMPVCRVTGVDVPIPFTAALEAASVPTAETIVNLVRNVWKNE